MFYIRAIFIKNDDMYLFIYTLRDDVHYLDLLWYFVCMLSTKTKACKKCQKYVSDQILTIYHFFVDIISVSQ